MKASKSNRIKRNRRRFLAHWKRMASHDHVTLPEEINDERFETIEDKYKESLRRMDDLLEGGCKEVELAEELLTCRLKDPCKSLACPMCVRNKRIQLIKKAFSLIDEEQEAYVLTIVFYQDAISDDQFEDWKPELIKKRLRAQIQRLGIAVRAIGSIELDRHSFQEQWLPHIHLLVIGDREDINKLRAFYKKRRNTEFDVRKVSRPMLIQKLKDPKDQISYLFKFWMARVEKSMIQSRKFRLRTAHHSMSLLKLNDLGLQRLLFDYSPRKAVNLHSKSASK